MNQNTIDLLHYLGGAALVLIGSIITWCLNEQSKRRFEEYKRKEVKYSALIRSLRGFYEDSFNKDLRNDFLNQLIYVGCTDLTR